MHEYEYICESLNLEEEAQMTEQSPTTIPPEPTPIEVRPTSQQSETNLYSDTTVTSLFGSHTINAGSLRTTVWQRYGYFVVGNAILFAFAKGEDPYLNATSALGGYFLCLLWLEMSYTDQGFLTARFREARRFKWPRLGAYANPFVSQLRSDAESRNKIHKLARLAIFIFTYLHVFTFLKILMKYLE